MTKFRDLSGMRFGQLIAISRAENKTSTQTKWNCKCDCGNEVVVFGANLTTNHSQSCGCVKSITVSLRVRKHGQSHIGSSGASSTEYMIWTNMLTRCYNENNNHYVNYGARGIKVCDRWKNDFSCFIEDMGLRPSKEHSIDRIDCNGDYTPENCRWADAYVQSRNQRVKKNNKSGFSGVFWSKQTKKWLVSIRYDGKQRHIGTFANIDEAVKARKEAELKHWGKSS